MLLQGFCEEDLAQVRCDYRNLICDDMEYSQIRGNEKHLRFSNEISSVFLCKNVEFY